MVDSVKYGPVELWWQAQTLKTQVDQDMKNGKPTAADYALLRQLVSNAQGLIATTTNDQVANNLNNFLSAIEGADPFANDVFDSATEKLGAESVFSGGYSLPSLTLPSDPGTMLIMLEDLEAQNAASSEKGSLANIQAGGQDQLIAAENSEAQDKKAQQAEQAAAAQTKVGNAEGIGSSIGGTIAAIFGLIAAILVTGLTLGGGVGLIAVASVGLTLAIFNDINTGLQQAGVQTTGVDGKSEPLDLSLGGLVKAIVQQQVKDGTIAVAPAKGKPGALVFKDQAALDSYTSGWTITANLLVTIAMCATGAGILKLCSSAPELADDAANLATDVSEEAKGVIQTLKNVMKQPGMASKVVEGA
ncbi:MAG TPA: hypothetical protein VK832_02720, partial [Burkholderiaceae bacterium]|nr:hypothetical protein [Burkholderiaceae bacterium]